MAELKERLEREQSSGTVTLRAITDGLLTSVGVIEQNEQLMRRFSSPVRLSRFDWQLPKDREQFLDVLAACHDEMVKSMSFRSFTQNRWPSASGKRWAA
jgi:hypothetical protein